MKRIPWRTFAHARKPYHERLFSPARQALTRSFNTSKPCFVVKPFLLADIGEGIREVQIIQWFVQPGARVEQFDKLCEVQSDKASVEITSRFDGVIKKLHYEADEMAIVGKPLVDIDIQSEISPEDEALTTPPSEHSAEQVTSQPPQESTAEAHDESTETTKEKTTEEEQKVENEKAKTVSQPTSSSKSSSGKASTLATPAVRHLTKELDVDLADVTGTGKDGRVLKEDVQKFASSRSSVSSEASQAPQTPTIGDRTINLTPVQSQMLKTMTRSLNIPHFLYSDAIDVSAITGLRQTLNASLSSGDDKLSLLPFLIKAVSLSLIEFPLLNARLDTSNPKNPQIIIRGSHNIGIAVDSPQGLLVPVIKSVQDLSVYEIAIEARRLSSLARQGKLTSKDMSGGTFSVSNVGSIGGGVVAPIIVESQLAIMGVGRTKIVPAFNEEGDIVKREECTLSWSADHRVVDGATVARCADRVRQLVESPERMLVKLR